MAVNFWFSAIVILLNGFYIVNIESSSDFPFIFFTEKTPDDMRFMPTLGNGHLGLTIFGDSIYMNGLYNGKEGLSHRARIPNYSNISISSAFKNDENLIEYSLNTRTGIFQIVQENNDFKIIQLIYLHRFYNRAIINELYIHRRNFQGDIKIKIQQNAGKPTEDVDFSEPIITFIKIPSTLMGNERNRNFQKQEYQNSESFENQLVYMIHGYTKEVENEHYQKMKQNVCCLWNYIPDEIVLMKEKRFVSYKFIMTVDELCSIAEQEMVDVLSQTNENLLNSHRNEWTEFWNTFNITISNNLPLQKIIYGSLFYLANSLPSIETNIQNHQYFGLSPTGLGRGETLADYEGHSFWDTEIWMLPTVTQMNPQWTKQLLNYRYRMLNTAKDNAKNLGYDGAKFPWESAFTGVETTQPCCPLVALLQHHITADISFAIRNYFATTYDIEWFSTEGCSLSSNIAKFWASRIEIDSKTGLYDIKNVMGPDEDHPNVTNNAYTNVIASYALNFGELTYLYCNNKLPSANPKWSDLAKNLKIPYDEILDYHPQYDGYKPPEIIKQADAILLGYPLLYSMNITTQRNDLEIYENLTRENGPAMTWAMHSINHLDIDQYLKANENFEKGYKNYIRGPFQVWSEVVTDRIGAINFLTGAGGFLQSLINGYAGVKIHLDYMEVRKPRLPPYSKEFIITGIKYLGAIFKITVNEHEALLQCLSVNKDRPLEIIYENKIYEIHQNLIYNIKGPKIIIKAVNNNLQKSIFGYNYKTVILI